MAMVETDFLISGAGPAGAALACFLSQHGLKGIMIAAAPGTADTPRAHITNMAALECLRDIGLDEECLRIASKTGCLEHNRWCHDMTGDEYGRIYSWGHDPKRAGDYDAASPLRHVDLPQTLLEPILVNFARKHGWDIRFSNTLQTFKVEDNGCYTSQILDGPSNQTYHIRSRYLFGCDGARSQIVRQLNLPLIAKPKGSVAINVIVEADLGPYMESRTGNLHWCIQPERESPEYSWMGIARMVKPWTEWLFIIFPKDAAVDTSRVTEEQWTEEVHRYIGNPSIPVKFKSVSTWKVNEIVAERYSEGNIFCLGDAVHRHPPFNGLGSNTCIQDAYNLAWKIAFVHKGLAQPSLLQSYSSERQPVGHGVIARANASFHAHLHVWQALGMTEPDLATRTAIFDELRAATPAGRKRRKEFREAIYGTRREFHAVGREMSQRYESSAVYVDDEGPRPPLPEDPDLELEITTYPGSRLPHAWLNTRKPGKKFSVRDLAGKGAFCLLTGIGGEKWREAGREVSKTLGVDINAYSIGWNQEFEDVYGEWVVRSEVEEEGVVLVRPDHFVCWRSKELMEDCVGKLQHVISTVLGQHQTN